MENKIASIGIEIQKVDQIESITNKIIEALDEFDGINSLFIIESLSIMTCSASIHASNDHKKMKAWLLFYINQTFETILQQRMEEKNEDE